MLHVERQNAFRQECSKKNALLADQPHLHACAANICGRLSLSVYPALQLRPPRVSNQVCTRMCICGWEKEASVSPTLAVTEESRLWGHAGVSGTAPNIIIQTARFPLGWEANIFMSWTLSFIFYTDLQCFLHSPEAWLIHRKLESVLIEKQTSRQQQNWD